MRNISISSAPCEKIRKFNFSGKYKTPSNQATSNFKLLVENNNSEYQLLFSGLFLFYKIFISSQDVVSCAFSPSCSEFSIIALKRDGFISGTLSTFDRLLRCHGLAPDKYVIDKNTGLLIDYP